MSDDPKEPASEGNDGSEDSEGSEASEASEGSQGSEGSEGSEGQGPHMVDCVKFGKRMEGLAKPPLKGEIGQKIYDNVSQEAWRMWLEHSKMLVNEFRLDLMSEAGQKVWFAELEKYFWGEGSQLPPDYEPMKAK